MKFVRKQWSFAFRATTGKTLAMVLAYYLVTALVACIILSVIGALPVMARLSAAAILWRIFTGLITAYYLVGAVLAVLCFLKKLK